MASKNTLLISSVGIAVVILLVVSVYFFVQYQNAKEESDEQKTLKLLQIERENDTLIKDVGSLVELPANEVPTIATVSDKNKLNKQLFFSKAENGDKVLIYKENGVAVIYRPASRKIVNFATGINIIDKMSGSQAEVGGVNTEPTPIEIEPTLIRVPNSEVTPTIQSKPTSIPTSVTQTPQN